jgi:hypothetical protein
LQSALLTSLNVWLLYRIGLALYGCRVARLGALLICLSPVLWPRMLLSEPLCTSLFLGALWVALVGRPGWRSALVAGVLMAGAAYVRVTSLAYLAVLGLVWWARMGRFRRAAGCTILCSAVVVAAFVPWTVRNWRQFGAFVPTCTNSGVSLLLGAYEGGSGREPPRLTGPVWERALQLRLVEYDELASDRYARAAALEWIAEHPVRWMGLGFAKVAWLCLSHPWHPPFELFGQTARPAPVVETGFKVLCQAASWLVLIGLACYVWKCRVVLRSGPQRLRWVLLVPLTAWLVVAGQAFVFHGIGRFRWPIEGLLILAGAWVLLEAAAGRAWPEMPAREAD